MPFGRKNGVIIRQGGAICIGCCRPPVDEGACGKLLAVITGLPSCADEANGTFVLCRLESDGPLGALGTYVACTPNFQIVYVPARVVSGTLVPALFQIFNLGFLPYYTSGYTGHDVEPGLVFFASDANVTVDGDGVVTVAGADAVDGDTTRFDGCSRFSTF